MTYKKNPETNKFIHRELYEINFGKIPRFYEVHHIDKNPTNNSLNNLIAIPQEFHIQLHELDKMGIILKTKSEVSIALSFYLRGKRNNKLDSLVKASKPLNDHVDEKINVIKKHKKQKRIHYSSIYRRKF